MIKEFGHKPVLLKECLEYLNIKSDGVYLDGTLGGAGHSSEILKRLNEDGILIGLDQDYEALTYAKTVLSETGSLAKFILVNKNFMYLKDVCKENDIKAVDGILLDIGVSSYQLDEGERGFSYNKDAKLDMRMDRNTGLTAEMIVNEFSEDELKGIIRNYGEENWAARIAKFIVEVRASKKIETTYELVEIIKKAIPHNARREGPHPAKRTFQAIRIAVNNELEVLKKAIEEGIKILKPGGRFCIITFHSLEDRIVKNAFQAMVNPCTCPKEFPVCICGKKSIAKLITKKPVVADEEELLSNLRSRSAKLRVLEKS